MQKVYEYAIRLRDLMSPTMQRLASTYERQTRTMSGSWQRVESMMSRSVQTVQTLRTRLASTFRLRVDSSEVDRANRRVGGLWAGLRKLASGSTLIAGFAGGLAGGLATQAANMATQALGASYTQTVGAAQRDEVTRFGMNELMGREGAARLIQDIDRYAPERREALMASSTKLAGAGVAPQAMMDTLVALNNVAALTNTSVEDLAMIQAKIKATGYVQGDEINMFKERGINLNPFIARVMGIQENQIAKAQAAGQIDYEAFAKAMQLYAGRGGQYEGVYERRRDSTVTGREEAVSARFNAQLMAMGTKLLPVKSAVLEFLSVVLDNLPVLGAAVERLVLAFRPLGEAVLTAMRGFGLISENGGTIASVMSTLAFAVDMVAKAISWVGQVMLFLANEPAALAIAATYALMKAWTLVNIAFAASPIGWVVGGIALLATGLAVAWDKVDWFREGMISMWETAKVVISALSQGFGAIADGLLAIGSGNFAGALASFGRIGNIVSSAKVQAAARASDAINSDRAVRLNKNMKLEASAGGFAPFNPTSDLTTGGGGGSLGTAAGVGSAVGNARSTNVRIEVRSLIERSEITVMNLQEGVDEIEARVTDALLRLVASSGRIALD